MAKLSPDDYAALFVASLDVAAALHPRSMQGGIGVSDLGYCSSKALWKVLEVQPTDAPTHRSAQHGVALHKMIGPARLMLQPGLLIENPVAVTLPSGVVIPGTADEVDQDEPGVTDYKTVATEAELTALRRTGSTEQQRFQRHLYYLGAHQVGLVPAQGMTRNVWIDRAGRAAMPYVEQEPFDMRVVQAADNWLASVMYSAEHGEETPQDKHYEHCRTFCEFFSHCRDGTGHADLTVTDEEMVRAAELVLVGRAKAKEGKELEAAGRVVLAPLQPAPGGDMIAYLCGDVRARWSWVNQADGPGYPKLIVEKAPQPVAPAPPRGRIAAVPYAEEDEPLVAQDVDCTPEWTI